MDWEKERESGLFSLSYFTRNVDKGDDVEKGHIVSLLYSPLSTSISFSLSLSSSDY